MSNPLDNVGGSERLTQKWEPVLEGINDNYTRKVTASLLENQAKAILNDRQKMISEAAVGDGTTTVGMLGTFQKFAMPIVRRVYPNLIFNQLGATQPMQGPVSQVFYLGHNRVYANTVQNVYSKFNMTYRGLVANRIGSSSATAPANGTFESGGGQTGGLGVTGANGGFPAFDVSNVIRAQDGSPSSTMGGKIASWPSENTTLGWAVSSGERLTGTGIPEISLQIQTQPVTARTRKMRALWTLEASQDLKAYHNLDLEQELTSLLSNELQLEIDRELIEDMRMIAYGVVDKDTNAAALGGWYPGSLDPKYNPNNFSNFPGQEPKVNDSAGQTGFAPGGFEYELTGDRPNSTDTNTPGSNVFVVDLTYFSDGAGSYAPQHIGHVYANLLATLNLASQDIYRTTFRGPGSWLITSPLMAAMLESAAKLEGGINSADRPTNIGNTSIEFKGKFAGRYDLFVDPMFPTDEILMGYKGSGPMDSGFIYCPYIPLQQLPTITDPESFQPRKGLLTRYGKVAIQPASRFFRVIRVVGGSADYLVRPFARNAKMLGDPTTSYR